MIVHYAFSKHKGMTYLVAFTCKPTVLTRRLAKRPVRYITAKLLMKRVARARYGKLRALARLDQLNEVANRMGADVIKFNNLFV